MGKVLTDITAQLEEKKKVTKYKEAPIEKAIDRYCKPISFEKLEKKVCQQIEYIKRQISKPLKLGLPPKAVCKRISKKNKEVCDYQYPVPLDANTNFKKMRMKAIKRLLR